MVDTLVILAPGLLGASVARAAHARGAARRIVIWARRPEARLELAAKAWCHAVVDTPEAAVAEADLVVLAAPVSHINSLIDRVAPHTSARTLITDVGSVKAEIRRHAEAALSAANTGATFIGSHPMAGSAQTGWRHSDPALFQDRTCFITPPTTSADSQLTTLVQFWRELGGNVVTVDADTHDEIVAHISHLPQVLATSLGNTLAAQPAHWSHLAGNGLRDTTRIAASDATMWIEILEQNREEILRAIGSFEDELHHFRAALANRDWTDLRARLERGKTWRNSLRP